MGELSIGYSIVTDAEASLRPLFNVNGDPVFDEPWQAEALAIADVLVSEGMFSAGAWSEALGKALRVAESEGAVDNQVTYYNCVLSALEQLVGEYSEIDQQAMAGKRKDWEQAYLSTPHGQPVRLK
jgi:nitrile hydratase accessory protein